MNEPINNSPLKEPADAVDGAAVLGYLERRIQTCHQQLEAERLNRRVLAGQREELNEAIADRDASIARLQGQIDEARSLHAALQPQQQAGPHS